MMNYFISLKTCLWIMGTSMALYVLGAFIIPQNLAVFSEINDMPLFTWLLRNRGELSVTFWIYPLLAAMALLVANLLICGYDSLRKGIRVRGSIELLSPQILHLGVVLALFGHLVSAATGYKQDLSLKLHERQVIRGHTIELASLDFQKTRDEDSTRWLVGLVVDGHAAALGPARPLFLDGIGFFAKSASQKKSTALIGLVRDPGVVWEIAGAVFFVLGAAGLFWGTLRVQ